MQSMGRNNRLAVVFGSLLLACSTAAASDERLEGLGEFVESALPEWDLPGMAVAVVTPDETLFAGGFGLRQVGYPERIDEHTLFQVGSTSKAFAAAAIGVLVDDGELEWDDPIAEYLPWLELSDPWVTRHMTIRDVLVHRSGLQDATYPVLAPMDSESVARKMRLLDNALPFRERYQYCNLGYNLAGLVVETVSGQPWAGFVEQRLLQPLGMGRSAGSPYRIWRSDDVAPVFLGTAPSGSVSHHQALRQNVAMPHGRDRRGTRRVLPWMSYDAMAAAGSVVSSVDDMARWLRMHLGGGAFDGIQVLSEQTVTELHAPQIPTTTYFLFADEPYATYAMGWSRSRFRNMTLISHGGGIFGFPAYAAFVPEHGIGIVVLANGSTWTPYYPHQDVVAWVLQRLLNLEPEDWHARVNAETEAILERVRQHHEKSETEREDDQPPSLPLAAYAGRYSDDLAGDLDIRLDGGELRLAFPGAGAYSGTLEHWQGDEFRLWHDGGDGGAWASTQVTFLLGESADVNTLDMGFFGVYRRVEPLSESE
jgi:CubicO group peptidase (beta-lactamase class C family)